MEKIWYDNYQAGVPKTIDPNRYASLVEMFSDICREFSNNIAFSNFGKNITYQQLERYSRYFSAYLQNILRLSKGDRIALMMPNILQFPIVMFGALRAGLIVVNINPLYTAVELEHQLKDAGAKTLVVLENFAATVEAAVKDITLDHIIITKMGDMFGFIKGSIVDVVVRYIKCAVPKWHLDRYIGFKNCLSLGKKASFQEASLSGDDIAFLQYTGGTTGKSKGAILTHRNMVSNVEQAYTWIAPITRPNHEIIITALPLYHIFSLTANCLTFMRFGAMNVLITNPRDMAGFVKILKCYTFTAITGVNTLFNGLLHQTGFAKLDFSQLRLSLGGGMAVQKFVADKWHQVTGVPLLEAYGLTETSPAVCINPMDLKQYNGTIGLPVCSTEVSIRDANDQELGFDEPGELWVKGPQVMQGYWNKPEETQAVLTEDKWLRTGDIATINQQGYVKIVDRKKDMILISGFNVYPNEIEDIIAMLDGVLEVAVIGVPHEEKGEIAKAFVVRKNTELSEQAIFAHCKKYLTAYKIPKIIEFRGSLPKTNVGKILRRHLKTERANS